MKILITESQDFSPKAIAELQNHFEVVQHDFNSQEELVAEMGDADVLFVRLRFKMTKEILQKAPKLKYILTATTGLDHIDTAYFETCGGKVISLKGEVDFLGSIPSTAEHTWALLLALLKRIPSSFTDVKSGNWNRDNFKGNNLRGKKIGILGLGRVGKQVAHFAEAFGMNVGYFDVISQTNTYKNFSNPQEMFAWADIVSIHIPYNADNENYVNEELLQHCQSNAILINTSRGNVWDEKCVAKLIRENKIAGLATDVLQNEFDKENIAQNPLVQLAQNGFNVIITPHIAGATYESMAMTEDFIAAQFLKIITL
ncbi:NAD(P)-dependent oxidoreductase [Flavobacterium terrisoli]|uniref:NAD(P)-dependent oxidoreductase n=1 Tax=Flavobacterium terrisoli TaxID=3242195 RepID=UPI0025429A29|nr:NAD(P)-dependent oxidoreductase [Flavobacterium buctense]